jgi:hypothetical protein
MVKITVEICQCDFCSVRDLVLPQCIVCGKHICIKHQNQVKFGVFEMRVKSDKLTSVYKEERYLCPECKGDRKAVYTKLAGELITEAEKVPELPPEEVIPK